MVDTKVVEYLSKLTGKTVDPDAPFGLSSAKKAQFASWLRREGVDFDYETIDRPKILLSEVLGGRAAAAQKAAPQSAPPSGAPTATVMTSGLRIGIDIENVENMPVARDYRSERFYKDHFTANELAHCLQAADERLSLCGIWAAKEALIKAGAATRGKKGVLSGIEIQHDARGAPQFPGCALSISHEGALAVAVCIHFGGAAA